MNVATHSIHPEDVNWRIVLGGRNSGVGYNGLVKCSATTNMPFPLQKNSHQRHEQPIRHAARSAAGKIWQRV